ncbi:hypothetical protein BUALT_Bualt01G0059900 [Buddleja alternifolia]|uniref:U6 snRNA phosphodiesterase n=1 Tax=Buddleja alternifolia TaxID=168488 RepID=A0AAV6Y5U1_9LAMI|nr:hypothetical protein BUALT_Bualt01G0059900 [Buddleja alternifolia]
MEALKASYGETSSDPDSVSDPTLSLLRPPNSLGAFDLPVQSSQSNRVRSFPHADGNYVLYVYIPVALPLTPKKELALFLKRVAPLVPELHVVDMDIPLTNLIKDEQKFEQIVSGKVFHVSLGRTVPIRVHQRDSVLAMLRQRLQSHRRYWIDFNKWEVFVNDDRTRTFLSIEVTARGLAEIKKQIESVNEVYKLHNLPEFYKILPYYIDAVSQNPRPHISIAWAVGDISNHLKSVIGKEIKRQDTIRGSSQKRNFTCVFNGVKCRIGRKTFEICKVQEE